DLPQQLRGNRHFLGEATPAARVGGSAKHHIADFDVFHAGSDFADPPGDLIALNERWFNFGLVLPLDQQDIGKAKRRRAYGHQRLTWTDTGIFEIGQPESVERPILLAN